MEAQRGLEHAVDQRPVDADALEIAEADVGEGLVELAGQRLVAGAGEVYDRESLGTPPSAPSKTQAAYWLDVRAGHSACGPALAKAVPIFSPQKLSLPKSRRHTQSRRV